MIYDKVGDFQDSGTSNKQTECIQCKSGSILILIIRTDTFFYQIVQRLFNSILYFFKVFKLPPHVMLISVKLIGITWVGSVFKGDLVHVQRITYTRTSIHTGWDFFF